MFSFVYEVFGISVVTQNISITLYYMVKYRVQSTSLRFRHFKCIETIGQNTPRCHN